LEQLSGIREQLPQYLSDAMNLTYGQYVPVAHLMNREDVERRLEALRRPSDKDAPADDLTPGLSENAVARPRRTPFGPLGDCDFTSPKRLPLLRKPGFQNSTNEPPMGEIVHVVRKGGVVQEVSLIESRILQSLNQHGPVMRAALQEVVGASALDEHLDGMQGVFRHLGMTLHRRADGMVFRLLPTDEDAPVTVHLAESKHPG
jgi:hypothetical protein